MSDLDHLSGVQLQDRAALWPRAAAWRTRWSQPIPLPRLPALPDHYLAVLTLPSELLGLGRLAAELTAADTHLYPLIRSAPVAHKRAPNASLAFVDPRQVRSHGPDAALDAPSTIRLDVSLNIDNHPTFTLLSFITLLWRAIGYPYKPSGVIDPALADALDRCAAVTPTQANPAKQLALALHERVPIFWGDGLAARVAADWAARQQWYAERAAFAVNTPDLVRGSLLARFPRYWPNTAHFVHLQLTPPDELAAQATHILTRRRFPVIALSAPASGLDAALYWLEFGEWLGLYSACLNNVDPADRVPHTILFSP